jgi:hypothetical protein
MEKLYIINKNEAGKIGKFNYNNMPDPVQGRQMLVRETTSQSA